MNRIPTVLTLIVLAWLAAAYWVVASGGSEPGVKLALGVLAPLPVGACLLAWRYRGRAAARHMLVGIVTGAILGGMGFAWLVWLGGAVSFDETPGAATVEAGVFGTACGAVCGTVAAGLFVIAAKLRPRGRD